MSEEKVSHDDLAAAWDAAQPAEEVAAEEPTETIEETVDEPIEEVEGEPEAVAAEPADDEPIPDEPDEPEDNAARSKLGRKVQYLETQLEQALGVIQKFQAPPAEPEDEIDDDMPVTKADIEKIIEQRETQKQQQAALYSDNYRNTTIRLGLDLEEAEHAEILKSIDSLQNPSRTGDPVIDAEVNFLKAQTAVYQKRLKAKSVPQNPLNKNKDVDPEAPLGGGAETKTSTRPRRMPKLDAQSQELIKHYGWDAERVTKALSGETPLNLVNPKGI